MRYIQLKYRIACLFLVLLVLLEIGCGRRLPTFPGGYRIFKSYSEMFGLVEVASSRVLIGGGPEGSILKCMKNGNNLLIYTEHKDFILNLKSGLYKEIELRELTSLEISKYESNVVFSIEEYDGVSIKIKSGNRHR